MNYNFTLGKKLEMQGSIRLVKLVHKKKKKDIRKTVGVSVRCNSNS